MKIGIITCFTKKNVNYGNRLQAYALNQYIRENYPQNSVETLWFASFKDYERTEKENLISRVKRKISRIVKPNHFYPMLQERLNRCNKFSEENTVLSKEIRKESLAHLDYDIMVTGSDVVWYQTKGKYKPIMFLDFSSEKKFRKIAYAASFGKDNIPQSNLDYVKKALQSFSAISVREKTSIEMLNNHGISNVKHCVDSTLLIQKNEWEELEEPVELGNIEKGSFLFVYLLGEDMTDRKAIIEFSQKNNCPIVTIPYARGRKNKSDKNFGDCQVLDCSPGQWLWLVHHCRIVITDSFHGVVFSTIFDKSFIAVQRDEFNISNRITDYLNSIGQSDKFTSIDSIADITKLSWDYAEINTKLEAMRQSSARFLSQALQDNVR